MDCKKEWKVQEKLQEFSAMSTRKEALYVTDTDRIKDCSVSPQ